MTQEYLKALKFIFDEALFSEFKNETHTKVRECHSIVYEALKRLEVIDNSNPSEALEKLDKILDYFGEAQIETMTLSKCNILTIKKALIKAQEQKDKIRAFDLINEKNIDIKLLKWAYPDLQAYNQKVRVEKDYWWRKELTQEEFEFIGKLAGAK